MDEIYIHSSIPPICSNDGFYGKIQYNKLDIGQKYCSDRNGHMIEAFKGFMNNSNAQKMNCECALARNYLTTSKPKCCTNGNYQSIQCIGGLCYCVDEYGRQLGEEVDQSNQNELACNDYCCESNVYVEGDWCYVDGAYFLHK